MHNLPARKMPCGCSWLRVCTNVCVDNSHDNVHTSIRVGHMMQHTQLPGSVAALACLSGDWHACLRKSQRGSGCIVCNWLTPVRPCNVAILSSPARTDCWGCTLRHGERTVLPHGGAAIFPCYSVAAARSLVTSVALQGLQGVRGLPCYPMKGGQIDHPACCVLNDYDTLGTLGGIEVLWVLTLTR